ncbi:hypothetical protein K7432_005449 [Basidiobolus ranarum]|uniref:Uncharacterized protein n=1 Tax=Basidiobolus ranarum TaxID=34480 RepID=A0ABR2WWP1_9FUNG
MVHFKTRENSHIVARDMADFELWREREGSSANIWEKSNHGSIVTSGYKESRYLPFAVIHPITITNIPLTYNVNVDKEELPGVAFDSAALADNIMDACRYVVSASNSRNQTAGSSYERVLAQRLSVDVLSLSKVHLQYEKKDFNFWMYGTQWDELTEENRYPERIWSSYCTIL